MKKHFIFSPYKDFFKPTDDKIKLYRQYYDNYNKNPQC